MSAKVAIVTGGAGGMGLGAARHLARAGHKVTILDRQADLAEKSAADIGGLGLEVDVTDRAQIDAAYDRVRAEYGPIQIVVTSAGIESFDAPTEITRELWDRIIGVNLTGTFESIQAALPDMLEAGWGRIVTISSSSAQSGAPHMAHYVASKGGVIALTKALSVDLAPQGITVNTIPPSIIDTPMLRNAAAKGLADPDAIAQMTSVRRIGTPDDIGAAVTFLCSDDAGFITGQQIGVNGGWYL
jgi:NAD(P)-dependent dehydrogenase (short-subunit alcohol dehydrogenase family)